MKLFVGLGNPCDRYARQRHNVGFMAVERIADRVRAAGWRSKFRGQLAEAELEGERVLLLKPMTFMNESGRSVADAAGFHKIERPDIVVFHDELDLAPFKLRVKQGGGVAGHNGLRSIDACLGSRDFKRVRLGIGHPGHKDRVTGHVLGDFAKSEREPLDAFLDAVADAAPLLAKGDDAGFMNRVAILTRPPEPERPAKTSTGAA
jgi:peptidyl-tRNA hydrolase, PTH1 family